MEILHQCDPRTAKSAKKICFKNYDEISVFTNLRDLSKIKSHNTAYFFLLKFKVNMLEETGSLHVNKD